RARRRHVRPGRVPLVPVGAAGLLAEVDTAVRTRDVGVAVDRNTEGVEARAAPRTLGVCRPRVVAARARLGDTTAHSGRRRLIARAAGGTRSRASRSARYGRVVSYSDLLDALARQHADLWALVSERSEEEWPLAAACPGWDVSDVVLHMAQTDELAVSSIEERFDVTAMSVEARGDGTVDDAAGLAVERDRGAPGVEVGARWERAASQ